MESDSSCGGVMEKMRDVMVESYENFDGVMRVMVEW